MQNDPHFLAFVGNVLALRLDHYESSGFTFTKVDVDVDIPANAKFARVLSVERDPVTGAKQREQIHSFIALCDNETKGLGKVLKGDVMKPATWKAPARHARGNIYDDYNGLENACSYGPGYLR